MQKLSYRNWYEFIMMSLLPEDKNGSAYVGEIYRRVSKKKRALKRPKKIKAVHPLLRINNIRRKKRKQFYQTIVEY